MFLYFQFSGQSMKITFTKNNFTDTVKRSQSKIILCFHFGGQKNKKNQFHKRTTLGPETVRKQISDQKIGELSTEQLKAHDQKSHQLISYFYFAGSKEQFLEPEIVVSSNQNFH